MAGMRTLPFIQFPTLWTTYAVTNWRNGVEELPRGEAPKLKTMSSNEIVLKRVGAEAALVLLLVASAVEGVVRTIIDLFALAYKACTLETVEFGYAKDHFFNDLKGTWVLIPMSIIALLGYNICDEQIGPVRSYEKLRTSYCGCLPKFY